MGRDADDGGADHLRILGLMAVNTLCSSKGSERTRRTRRRDRSALGVAVLVLTCCVLVGAAVDASGVATAKTGALSKPRLLTCSGKAVTKPPSYVIFCADANGVLERIHWLSWGTESAHARATYSANDCTPNCASGRFVNYAATAALSAPKHTRYGVLFSELFVHYRSAGKTKTFVQMLPLKPL